MLSPTTFPSRVVNADLPRAYVDSGYSLGSSLGQTYMTGGAVAEQEDFHDKTRRIQHNRVMNVDRSVKFSERNFLKGGTPQLLPKPQPQGSFQMPFNAAGNSLNPRGLMGSGYRTEAGMAYGKKRLLERGEQEEQLRKAREMGEEPSAFAPPLLATTEDSAEKIGLLLNLEEFLTAFIEGEYAKYPVENVNKMYQTILKIGDQFTPEELRLAKENLRDVVRSMVELRVGSEEGGAEEVSTSLYNATTRLFAAFEAWYVTIDIEDPKARKRAIKTLTKRLSRPLDERLGAEQLGKPGVLRRREAREGRERRRRRRRDAADEAAAALEG